MVMQVLYIAVGGAIGAVSRFAVTNAAGRMSTSEFPWGTLAVNVFGSFAVGMALAALDRFVSAENMRAFFIIGVLGSFTTFSAYSIETLNLMRHGNLKLALLNVLSNNGLALVAAVLGFVILRSALERLV